MRTKMTGLHCRRAGNGLASATSFAFACLCHWHNRIL